MSGCVSAWSTGKYTLYIALSTLYVAINTAFTVLGYF
jgi:hypothetical protein